MDSKVEKLATEIATLNDTEQRALLERVAELTFRRGLTTLSTQYRERLRKQGELNQSAEEILAALKRTREEIAARDYHG